MRTNRELSLVVDSVSQALLWLYVQSEAQKLYPLGLRGAQEVNSLFESLESADTVDKARAEAALAEASKRLGVEPKALLFTLDQVREDPYCKFLLSLWRDRSVKAAAVGA